MSMLNCFLLVTIILFTYLVISYYMKIKYICKVIDEVIKGNVHGRVRLQSHIKSFNLMINRINRLIVTLKEGEEKNKKSEESRKKMISNISHDLRTPLTSMLGYMEIILDDPALAEDKKKEYENIVYKKGNLLLDLMEEFFQISKLDSKDIKLEITRINISELIRENIVAFFSEFRKLNIEPKINLQVEDLYVFSDAKALNRILGNLISNALRYGKNASIVGIKLIDTNDKVFIEIWDNGEGIPEEDINYIFDRLYTVEKSRGIKSKGSGLGLTIVKKLVEALCGEICVESIPSEKTAFTISLPKNISSDNRKN